jgi:hypothetical protein
MQALLNLNKPRMKGLMMHSKLMPGTAIIVPAPQEVGGAPDTLANIPFWDTLCGVPTRFCGGYDRKEQARAPYVEGRWVEANDPTTGFDYTWHTITREVKWVIDVEYEKLLEAWKQREKQRVKEQRLLQKQKVREGKELEKQRERERREHETENVRADISIR